MTCFEELIKQLILILSIIILLIMFESCRFNDSHFVQSRYYPSGKILSKTPYSLPDSLKDGTYREYYENGNLKKEISFLKGDLIDSSLRYFESGKLEFKEVYGIDTIYSYNYHQSGGIALKQKFLKRKKPIKIGWSVFYDKDGNLTESIQYVRIKNRAFLNQVLKYNDKRIVVDSSKYYRFQLQTTENPDFPNLKINYFPMTEDAETFMILGDNLNDDFSNIDDVRLDTIFMEGNELTVENFKNNKRLFKGFFYEYGLENLGEITEDSVKIRTSENWSYFTLTVSAHK